MNDKYSRTFLQQATAIIACLVNDPIIKLYMQTEKPWIAFIGRASTRTLEQMR